MAAGGHIGFLVQLISPEGNVVFEYVVPPNTPPCDSLCIFGKRNDQNPKSKMAATNKMADTTI